MRVVISISGGMDSTTLLGMALSEGHEVTLVHFQYASKHNVYEKIAINAILRYYRLHFIDVVNLSSVFEHTKSALLRSGGAIPEGHYEAKTMTQTVVPGRNLIFTSVAAAIAESRDIDAIWLGIHSGDHAIYPDCRPEFYEAVKQSVEASTEGRVSVEAPLLALDKAKILEIGYALEKPVPYHLTRTCYKDQSVSCGVCGSCQERLIAFEQIQRADPIPYESRVVLPKDEPPQEPESPQEPVAKKKKK